ncbi:ABC transporter ATP-binding protein [Microbispora triticiradicis]|uniref:ABC transporter ATP-binding protein n=2 Tax=Microbispora TaxID=2005 RepID=A0ABY3M000_9ACTN|nr:MULTISPECIES: ABC transporter ATP-binding protein [Microbispora]TLP63664.1 ABC transporter ATP-binding protein [Microbispora fusca]TYB60412.1 ABC transporter ATP-binding protein [Microbispora tritici]
MIEIRGLTKRYGDVTAVDGLSFDVRPGVVTGFLGPNGAGKTSTMRMILGLDRPTSGSATIGGRRYADLPTPLREVGALLDAHAVHPYRSAGKHLLALARGNGIGRRRVDEVLGLVGLADVAGRRPGGFSLGMKQRLGIAAALLGDPGVVLLDEPVNGLDPEGIRWIRSLTRDLASEGRTVLLSSHLMSEMALTADHLVVVGRGRLLADTGLDAFVRSAARETVVVRTPGARPLAALLEEAGATVRPGAGDELLVTGLSGATVGDVAGAHGIVLHELTPRRASLEEAYLELTGGSADFASAGARPATPAETQATTASMTTSGAAR